MNKRYILGSLLILVLVGWNGSPVRAQTTVISNTSTSVISTGSVGTATATSGSNAACLQLSSILKKGSSDDPMTIGVQALQRFLVASGYLGAAPNGYFGSQTETALKKYQSRVGIQQTGQTGPLTRAALAKDTCTAQTTTATPTTQTANPSQTTTQTSSQTASAASAIPVGNVTIAPYNSTDTLTLTNMFTVRWNAQVGVIYNITLEDAYGVGKGFVATGIGGSSYSWNVGTLFSSALQDTTVVQPGRYRLHVRSSGSGSVSDQYSSDFLIVPPPITIVSALPNMITNDGKSTLLVYGSGFNTMTIASLTGPGGVVGLARQFASPDGKFVAFGIPTVSPAGTYNLQMNNYYSDATSTTSNLVTVQIVNP